MVTSSRSDGSRAEVDESVDLSGGRMPLALERRILDWFGDRDVLVATKDGLLVVLAPAGPAAAGQPSPHRPAVKDIGGLMHAELNRQRHGRPWRVTVGRHYPGAYGIARSYEEAREALTMAVRSPTSRRCSWRAPCWSSASTSSESSRSSRDLEADRS